MRSVKAVTVFVAVLACAARAQEKKASSPDATRQTKPVPNWTEKDELPLLRADRIKPVRDAESFGDVIGGLRLQYPKGGGKPRPATEPPFSTDEQAVAAARAWLTAHFGHLQEGASLEVKTVYRSSSGRPKPANDSDIGHTIVFCEHFRGIPTDNYTTVCITGKTQISATVDIRRYTPVESPKRIVDAAAAKEVWRKGLAAHESTAATLDNLRRRRSQGLSSCGCPRAGFATDSTFLAPTWNVDGGIMMVDGHSGEPWVND